MIYQLEEILDLIHSAGHNVCERRGQLLFQASFRGGDFFENAGRGIKMSGFRHHHVTANLTEICSFPYHHVSFH